MRCRDAGRRAGVGDWQDRVSDTADDPCTGAPDGVEQIVADALIFAQEIIGRTVEPLIDALAGLSRGGRFGRWTADAPRPASRGVHE